MAEKRQGCEEEKMGEKRAVWRRARETEGSGMAARSPCSWRWAFIAAATPPLLSMAAAAQAAVRSALPPSFLALDNLAAGHGDRQR